MHAVQLCSSAKTSSFPAHAHFVNIRNSCIATEETTLLEKEKMTSMSKPPSIRAAGFTGSCQTSIRHSPKGRHVTDFASAPFNSSRSKPPDYASCRFPGSDFDPAVLFDGLTFLRLNGEGNEGRWGWLRGNLGPSGSPSSRLRFRCLLLATFGVVSPRLPASKHGQHHPGQVMRSGHHRDLLSRRITMADALKILS